VVIGKRTGERSKPIKQTSKRNLRGCFKERERELASPCPGAEIKSHTPGISSGPPRRMCGGGGGVLGGGLGVILAQARYRKFLQNYSDITKTQAREWKRLKKLQMERGLTGGQKGENKGEKTK